MMNIEQIYTGCLAQGAYYITSEGEAAIIDPLREIQPYLDRLQRDGVTLKYIFETHFHADFVSGHLDLAKATGAQIIYGPTAQPGFEVHIAQDNETFTIGGIQVVALHTPGHTMESTVYLLRDESGKDHCIFTGDTLFLGDVGRPDLAQKAADMTQDQLAGMLYDSLMNKIMPLADEVIVYPAHGAGSACGKNMMKETVDTLGNQKRMNYALNQPDKASFIHAVTDGLASPPAYFPHNVAMNKHGYDAFQSVMERGMKGLTVDEFESARHATGALVLDTRPAAQFCQGFIPGALNIGLGGDFAPWVGAMIGDVKTPILVITEVGKEQEAVTRLARVGFDQVHGHLAGGFESWLSANKPMDKVHRITATEMVEQLAQKQEPIIDVRKCAEYDAGHVAGAEKHGLADIHAWVDGMKGREHFFLHCQGGYRSMIAASILKSHGVNDFTEIEGGFGAISKTGIAIESTPELA
jgi:hydroxyacylglutathione hydrolase